MTFARRIGIAAAVASLVPLLFDLLISLEFRASLRQTRAIARQRQALTVSAEIQRLIVDLETGLRGFHLTGEESYLEPYRTALHRYEGMFRELGSLLAGTPEKRLVEKIRRDFDRWRVEWVQARIGLLRRFKPRQTAEGILLANLPEELGGTAGKKMTDDLRVQLDGLSELLRSRIARDLEVRRRTQQRLSTLLWAAAIVFSLVILLWAVWIARLYRRRSGPLFAAIEAAGGGDYREVPLSGADEPARIASEFNRMVQEVRRRDSELRESQERLQAILDNAPAVIYLKDLEGRYLLVNRRFETSFRVRREEVLGKTADEIFPLEMAEAYRANDRRVFEVDTALEIEELASQEDGVHAYLSVKFPLRDASGGPTALCGISTDITDRKRAEEALRKYADEIGDLYDNAPCGYHSLDADGIFVRVNETELAWLGYSREELIGKKRITDLLTAQSLEIFMRDQQQFRQTGLVRDVEFELIRKDGSVLPVSLSATAVRDGEGNLLGSRTTLFDITKRRRVDQELRRTEAFLSSIVENIPSMIFVKDAENLRFVRVNRAGEKLTGIPREELLGKNDGDLFPKEQADLFTSQDREVLEGRGLRDIPEEPILTKSGETRLLHTRKIPILAEATGEPLYLLGISEDITDLKRAEEEVNRFFGLSLDLLCIADFEGYFRRLNPAWERTLGFSIPELLSKPFLEFLHPEDRPTTLAESGKLGAKEHETVSFTNRYLCADGSYKWLLWNAKSDPVRKLIYAAARDITEEKLAQEEIAELNAQLGRRVSELAALNHELEAFSYSVSHDLRSPLRHIAGFAQLLEKNASASLDEKARRHLATIGDAARRMGSLIDDLLVFSRMGRAEMRLTRVALGPLVKEIRAELAGEASGREVVWKVNGLPEVQGDPSLLRQVLVNLMSNALKYTGPREKAEIEIGWHPGPEGDTVLFVRDNGVGFDMKYADKLFGVFQRLHRAEEFEGTGIGLANVRRIVQRHGGRTWAEGAVDRGATFYFSLPPDQEDRT